MRRRVESWSIAKLQKERTRISFPEYQREKSLWPNEKKGMLIDSILLDIDIPKLYFNELYDKSVEVVDGQQRLWAIWEFLDDKYEYQSGSHKALFSKLSKEKQVWILEYTLQLTIFHDADEEYLRQLFVRLQLGLLLNTGEKLHAASGKMKNFVFNIIASHDFVKSIGIPERRYAKQTLGAQIAINSFTHAKLDQFARTRYDDLLQFFQEYADPQGKDLDRFNRQSKLIVDTLDMLSRCFGDKAKDLKNRSYVLSIYLFMEQHHISAEECRQFQTFVFLLWRRLREEGRLGIDRKNRELYTFQSLLSSAPGEQYQIERRSQKLEEYYGFYKSDGKIKGD